MEPEENFFKFPSRAITLLSIFFSLIIVCFFATLLFSVAQVKWTTEQATTTINKENFTIIYPINISNNGFYTINLQINTFIRDKNGIILNSTSSYPPIKPKENKCLPYNLTINLKKVLATDINYLFNSTEFTVTQKISLNLANLIPVTITLNNTVPWGAPLSKFNVSHSQTPLNKTHIKLTFKIKFKNESPFAINGTFTIAGFQNTQEIFSATEKVNVPPGTLTEINFNLIIPTEKAYDKVTLTIQTPIFNWEEKIYG